MTPAIPRTVLSIVTLLEKHWTGPLLNLMVEKAELLGTVTGNN